MKITADESLMQAVNALKDAADTTQDAMRQSAIESVNRVWGPALASASGTSPERRILADGASSEIGPASITLHAGAGGPLSGGLGAQSWPALEFGMTPVQITAPNRRKKIRIAGSGREVTVQTKVWVGKNLKPRNPDGYVIFPTVRKHGPEFVAAWIYGLIGKWVGTPFDVKKG